MDEKKYNKLKLEFMQVVKSKGAMGIFGKYYKDEQVACFDDLFDLARKVFDRDFFPGLHPSKAELIYDHHLECYDDRTFVESACNDFFCANLKLLRNRPKGSVKGQIELKL